MKPEYIERIYAGWLAKIIGIRLGAPIEGWTYEKIRDVYGELDHYPVEYTRFAADDDSNGPLFFLRALENHKTDVKAQDVAEALLNYAPYEHGFFWWGGYGISTEHTAYLNLRAGIPAPRSGSIQQNGAAVAEQIGGQIFIDTWGLVSPGNPDQAARFAREAASVTHDGNGVYGGIFVAVCISYAFEEQDIHRILEKGLSYIPADCEYARGVRAVMAYHEEHPESWRDCYQYVKNHFGYDRYPGNCHILPNICVMILALLYGEGDFDRTLTICNMCGWDTDCNVGNVATIMGVRNGLSGIDYDTWRKPVNDFLACSSVIGSLNIMDIPYGALYIAKLAYAVAGETLPEPWRTLAVERIDSCHFEFPGSTHAMNVRTGSGGKECTILNTDETAYTGCRALKVIARQVDAGETVFVYRKTYYVPQDFHDSRYDPEFSPLVYPGQMLHGSVYLPEYGQASRVSLYVHEAHSGRIYESEKMEVPTGRWTALTYRIPAMEGALIDEMGVCFQVLSTDPRFGDFVGILDDLYADAQPRYTLEMDRETVERWGGLHRSISQFTRLKGILDLREGRLHLSGADYAECYTGRYDWTDYTAEFTFTPLTGSEHRVNVRVQGAIRSYAVALMPGQRAAILKNDNGYRVLKETVYSWEAGQEYTIRVTVKDRRIRAVINQKCVLEYTDNDETPYLTGQIGMSVGMGGHTQYRRIRIEPCEEKGDTL